MLFGDLGVGKTIFVKGIGHELGIDNIVSPTFVIYYEYPVSHKGVEMLYHFDLYRIQVEDEFDDLRIEHLLKPRTVMCIEWSEKSAQIVDKLRSKAYVVFVQFSHCPHGPHGPHNERELKIY